MSNTTRHQKQKIFLSYAHKIEGNQDHTADLVEAIRQRLEASGIEAWIDRQQLHPGKDWREGITRGIDESDRVLSFLSTRSIRDPGVCLDEIGIAMNHKHGAIATLLAEKEVEYKIPASVAHIQYFDVSDWAVVHQQGEEIWTTWLDSVMEKILAIIIANEGFSGEIQDLQRILSPTPDSTKIGRLIENGLVGRQWVKQSIEEWRITQPKQRLFWVIGEPGMGKSAISADLIHKSKLQVVAYHFCDYQLPESRRAHNFVCNLAFMLAARLPDYRYLLIGTLAALPKPLPQMAATELMERLLIHPLRNKIDGGQSSDRLLIVIDALDEAEIELVSLLSNYVDALPSWLGCVITSRPNVQMLLSRNKAFELRSEDPRNAKDLLEYLHDWQLTDPSAPLNDQTRTALINASQGNMLYLALAREGYTRGVFSLTNPCDLPQGLGAVYLQWMIRQFSLDPFSHPAWNERCYPMLELLCASPEPIPQNLLSLLLNWKGQDKLLALRPLGSLITQEGENLRLCHRSLSEWLVNPTILHDYWINIADGQLTLLHGLIPMLSKALNEKSPEYIHRAVPILLSGLDDTQCKNLLETQKSETLHHISLLGDFWSQFPNISSWQLQVHLYTWLISQYESQSDIYLKEYSESLCKLGNVFLNCGSYSQAVGLLRKAYELQSDKFGSTHPATLLSLRALASGWYGEGQYNKAATLQEQELSLRENQNVIDFPEILITKTNLARSQYAAGHYALAKQLHQEILATQQLKFGTEDPRTISSMSALSSALFALGELDTAEVINIQVFEYWCKVLGKEHPRTLTSASYLASTYYSRGHYVKARDLQTEVLVSRQRTLGTEHPDTLITSGWLALSVRALGDLEYAKEAQQDLIVKLTEILGANHPSTLFQQNFLADTCFELADYVKAQSIQEHVISKRSQILGVSHPDTLVSQAGLAITFLKLGDVNKANTLLNEVAEKISTSLGKNHPDTLFTFKLFHESNKLTEESIASQKINPQRTTELANQTTTRPIHYTNSILINRTYGIEI